MRNYQKQRVPKQGTHRLVRWMWREINRQHASQEDIAARSGVSSSAMRKWRAGNRSPRMFDFDAIAQVLGYKLTVRKIKDD
jgi:transcriptional regulator with XRE-family HTH domain